MREIKFRVWVEDVKCMRDVSNIAFNSTGIKFIYPYKGVPSKNSGSSRATWYQVAAVERITPERGTIMQYTGLKDKNGIDIYEGDIIKSNVPTELEGDALKVTCHRGYFGVTSDDFEYEPLMIHSPTGEIIGNIYENGDLLNE